LHDNTTLYKINQNLEYVDFEHEPLHIKAILEKTLQQMYEEQENDVFDLD